MSKLREKVIKAETTFNKCLLERKSEVRLLMVSVLTGENLLLLGPPGVAKSALLLNLKHLVKDSKCFTVGLNKFTDMSELFGPVKLSGLKQDKYERKTEGYLPDVDFAFLDEVFKASSAINNTLLQVMNERTYTEEGVSRRIPLQCLVGASNEIPSNEGDQKGLDAMFDRFLIRCVVSPLKSRASIEKLLSGKDEDFIPSFDEEDKLTLDEIKTIRKEIKDIPLSKEFKDAYVKLITDDLKSKMKRVVSDRRLRRSINLVKAEAWLDGAPEVGLSHGRILEHVLWSSLDDGQVSEVKELVLNRFGASKVTHNQLIAQLLEVYENTKVNDKTEALTFMSKSKEIRDSLYKLRDACSNPHEKKAIEQEIEVAKELITNFTKKLAEG
jgi:MoxR-like ATPase